MTDTSDNNNYNDTDPNTTDDEPTVVPVIQNPKWVLTKTAVETEYDQVGDVLNYTIKLENTGNITIYSVAMSDTRADASPVRVADQIGDNDDVLELGEIWMYTAKHTVVQADLANRKHINIAEANGLPAGGTLAPAKGEVEVLAKYFPIAENNSATTPENTPVSGNLLDNDSHPARLSLRVTQFVINGNTYPAGTSVTLPGVGVLLINANGSYTFTPVPLYSGQVPTATYTIADTDGRTDVADLNITVLPYDKPNIRLPDFFTPNGDGINEEILPIIPGIDRLRCFKVYNRFGNLVFETIGKNKAWDGKYRGQVQPADTYIWLIEGFDKSGKLVKRTGMFTLVR